MINWCHPYCLDDTIIIIATAATAPTMLSSLILVDLGKRILKWQGSLIIWHEMRRHVLNWQKHKPPVQRCWAEKLLDSCPICITGKDSKPGSNPRCLCVAHHLYCSWLCPFPWFCILLWELRSYDTRDVRVLYKHLVKYGTGFFCSDDFVLNGVVPWFNKGFVWRIFLGLLAIDSTCTFLMCLGTVTCKYTMLMLYLLHTLR